MKFKQWIESWDKVQFDEDEHRRKPDPEIFMFSMPATHLVKLSGVYYRRYGEGLEADGIQRAHETQRSQNILDFVRYGYPYCEMTEYQRRAFDVEDLRKPGWLPTAIVVNILGREDERMTQRVAHDDLVTISEDKDGTWLNLPSVSSNWQPQGLPPIEVVDGQHRLFAFKNLDDQELANFHLPVVAFRGLDIGWQAYIFWAINVSPKKLNPSHAFDLFPLLRTQDWLDKFSGHSIYREARAQELTEILYRHAESPWKNRINMLGVRGKGGVSQASWVRALIHSLLGSGKQGISGLYGDNFRYIGQPLNWPRAQQAAFLIGFWEELRVAIRDGDLAWQLALRPGPLLNGDIRDDAFGGSKTLLNQEQGVRALAMVINGIFYLNAEILKLHTWKCVTAIRDGVTSDEDVRAAIQDLRLQPFFQKIRSLARALASYDWRSSEADGLSEAQKREKQALRGAGGYSVLRDDLLKLLVAQDDWYSEAANKILQAS